MPELIRCPACQKTLKLPNELVGTEVQCPTCEGIFLAQSEGTPSLSSPAESPPPVPVDNSPAPGPRPPKTRSLESRKSPARRRPRPRKDDYEDDYDEYDDDYDDDYDDEYDDDYDDDDDYQYGRRRDLVPHRGSVVLTLGIISIVSLMFIIFCSFFGIIFPLIMGPMAWFMGQSDLREIREGRMDPDGEGNTQAGRICGIIATIGGLLELLLVCGFVGFFIFMAMNNKL